MNTMPSGIRNSRGAALALGCLMTITCCATAAGLSDHGAYPAMAAVSHYRMASKADEIALAKSAAPASIADHAEVMVLGMYGYETAVKGTNGFVCLVVRSWDVDFADPEFWNPKMRAPQCMNAASVRSVLPRYLERTEWALAGISRNEMQARESAEWAAGTLKAPEIGAMCFMMSKDGYLNDAVAGPWHPHVMFYLPRTGGSQWGADLHDSPLESDSVNYAKTTILFVMVPNWSDGTPGPQMQK